MKTYVFVDTGKGYATYEQPTPAPLFQKEFQLETIPNEATLEIVVAGLYLLFINGKDITEGVLSPYFSNPDDILYSKTYDLRPYLKKGKNSIWVLLGNGTANPIGGEIWGHDKGSFRREPCFSLSFTSSEISFTSSDMVYSNSPLLFNDLRCGTFFDNRFLDTTTYPAHICESPKGTIKESALEPIKCIRTLAPQNIQEASRRDYRVRDAYTKKLHTEPTFVGFSPLSGGYVYDFGENIAGICELHIRGTVGQRIDLLYTELLTEGMPDSINIDVYPDGCNQRDVYVCNSNETVTYTPPFTYHGFRYVYVSGITKDQATKELLTCKVLRNSFAELATFSCNDEISNQIFQMVKRSDEGNMLNNITDCPHREKNGWSGDAAISANQILTLYDAKELYREFLHNFRVSSKDSMTYPSLIPSSNNPDDYPIWDSVLVYGTYEAYLRTGDKSIVTENIDAILKNLFYWLSKKDERGIVESGLGDWLPPDTAPSTYNSPLGFTCSALLYDELEKTKYLLKELNQTEQISIIEKEQTKLLTAIQNEYISCGVIGVGKTKKYVKDSYRVCQTSQVLGLKFGLFKNEDLDEAKKTLLDLIQEKNHSFDCGFLGMRYLFEVLSDIGESELAYKMITKPDYPSYANWIYRGETTLCERFSKPGYRVGSHNHHFLGSVGAWYIDTVLGLKQNYYGNCVDFVRICPQRISSITDAQGSIKTPNGKVQVHLYYEQNWKLDVNTFGHVELEVDAKDYLVNIIHHS